LSKCDNYHSFETQSLISYGIYKYIIVLDNFRCGSDNLPPAGCTQYFFGSDTGKFVCNTNNFKIEEIFGWALLQAASKVHNFFSLFVSSCLVWHGRKTLTFFYILKKILSRCIRIILKVNDILLLKLTSMGAELQSQNRVDVCYGKTFGLGY
jgi:hypothetical protein